MPLLRAASALLGPRPLRRLALLGTATFAVPPITAAAALMTLDAVKKNDRKEREAPRPGTFEASVRDSRLTIYTSGSDVYADMLAAIDGAEHTVLMETFIWKGDEMGARFVDAFNRAAERGVDVHVLYDGFGNLVVDRKFYRTISPKVHVRRLPGFARPYWQGILRHTGFNHSKILIVDDETGFVGGYNIGSLYSRQWRDTHLRAEGPVVWGLRNSMRRVWNEVAKDSQAEVAWIPPDEWDPAMRVSANLPLQLVYPIRQTYLEAIERAQDHIYLNTPYFIPDQQVLHALVDAAQRGVDVRVMIPKKSNHIVADFAARGSYGQLLDAGVTILLYEAAMIHAKTATIDGIWSTIGTANIDRLSLSFNYETNVEIIDRDFAAEMEKVFAADSEHCETLQSPRWRERHPIARLTEQALVPLRPFL
ncbi:phospholipase D-like domain-containing protein [Brachybacterium sp. JHP9]|uniref:Phospholipase D-like domain-containing protein n=1 Tax=Brachybacterium equifaecis TaxID=2910770 RepID=A0ABT0R3T5_9MICO|nr:phospholipase D-like domain-containing protein [Brachybacterium equifaecis]MCL6423580.1 phospholipase D-like domain-containing protein [Brachybacterium equifaecis]